MKHSATPELIAHSRPRSRSLDALKLKRHFLLLPGVLDRRAANLLNSTMKGLIAVPNKFDPAPFDKYAAKQNQTPEADDEALRSALEGSFPASDPVSIAQPARSKHDRLRRPLLWQKITSLFR